MENLDPTATPGTPGTVEGQPAASGQQPEPQVDPVATKLAELEEQNKNLQYRLTQQGRELKQFKGSQPQTPAQQPEDFDWANPGASIGKYVGKALSDFESRQDQRRQAEEMIRQTAEQNGIPVPKLQEYYAKLQEASTDPYELMNTVARMYRADHAEEAITQARRAAQESVERNARGVTSQGGATQPLPSQKAVADMNDKELDEYVMRTYGKAEWPS